MTLPIGGRIALPSTINTAISVLKNTSLLLLIGYPELTYVANSIQSNTFRVFETVHRARSSATSRSCGRSRR